MKIPYEKMGNAKKVRLTFESIEGINSEDMLPGEWAILYNEIPIKKMDNSNLFMVYPDCPRVALLLIRQLLNDKLTKEEQDELIIITKNDSDIAEIILQNKEAPELKRFNNYIDNDSYNIFNPAPKYLKTSKGTRKNKFWESPSFF